MEKWVMLDEVVDDLGNIYAISDFGRIQNVLTGNYRRVLMNNTNVPVVSLSVDGKIFTRSLALLVAKAFLPEPESDHFDTPTHLNGDRLDCRAENLTWRPRWYAIMYHRQFTHPEPIVRINRNNRTRLSGGGSKVIAIETGEVFDNPTDAAQYYGILEADIIRSIYNIDGSRQVRLIGYSFESVD